MIHVARKKSVFSEIENEMLSQLSCIGMESK